MFHNPITLRNILYLRSITNCTLAVSSIELNTKLSDSTFNRSCDVVDDLGKFGGVKENDDVILRVHHRTPFLKTRRINNEQEKIVHHLPKEDISLHRYIIKMEANVLFHYQMERVYFISSFPVDKIIT